MFSLFAHSKQDFAKVSIEHVLSDCAPSAELTSKFLEKGKRLTLDRDQILFHKGEAANSVYLVNYGEVELFMPISDVRGIGFRAKAGSLVGLPAAFSNEPYSMTAVAWKGAELSEMKREKFCELIATSPSLSLDVLKILASETRAARTAICERLRRNSRVRGN
jgi:CRP-like cAMP-binding protein